MILFFEYSTLHWTETRFLRRLNLQLDRSLRNGGELLISQTPKTVTSWILIFGESEAPIQSMRSDLYTMRLRRALYLLYCILIAQVFLTTNQVAAWQAITRRSAHAAESATERSDLHPTVPRISKRNGWFRNLLRDT